MSKLLNTADAAKTKGVSERRIRQLIALGTLKAEKLGRDYVIQEADLAKLKTYGKKGRPSKTA